MKIKKLKPYFLPVAGFFAVLAVVDYSDQHYRRAIFNSLLAVLQIALFVWSRASSPGTPSVK